MGMGDISNLVGIWWVTQNVLLVRPWSLKQYISPSHRVKQMFLEDHIMNWEKRFIKSFLDKIIGSSKI